MEKIEIGLILNLQVKQMWKRIRKCMFENSNPSSDGNLGEKVISEFRLKKQEDGEKYCTSRKESGKFTKRFLQEII